MFRTHRLTFTSASLLLLAPYAVAAQYSFVNIADTCGPFESFDFLKQAVSDTGTVAFIGTQGGVTGTYVGDGISTVNIVPNLSLAGIGALNESGVAVGTRSEYTPFQEWTVSLHEASSTQILAEATSDAAVTRFVDGDDINDAGVVAIRSYAFTNGSIGSEQMSIIRWFNGTSSTVLETTEGLVFNDVRLNERGDVAFYGWKHNEESAGFYRTDGTTLTLIADSTGPLSLEDSPLAMNDSGDVAFWSPLDAGGNGIFVGDGGPLTTVVIADPTTPFYSVHDRLDMNNQGTVAFFAGLWDGRRGIFTGADPVNDKVVAHGDFLFGQFVTGLGRPHLNERGDLAFWYEVRDPREPDGYRYGIALAVKESPIAGDFNHDGTVDAADYVVWRKGIGVAPTQDNYNLWRTHFGQTLVTGSGSSSPSVVSPSANVPEPCAIVLAALSVIGLGFHRSKSRSRPGHKTGAQH